MSGQISSATNIIIENCSNASEISGTTEYSGGLAGQVYVSNTILSIMGSSNSGNITGRGGLIGYLSGSSSNTPTLTIDKCYNTGNITCKYDEAGGIIAEISNVKNVIIQNCYNTGSITLTVGGGDYVGGIVGNMLSANGKIYNCYNTGEFINGCDRVAGIIGYYGGSSADNSIIVENCYNTASFTAHNWAGGIFGDDENGSGNSTIKNCYNEGDITADYVGGIAGDSVNTIINCYNTGDITGVKNGSGSIGGILGMGYSSADNPNIIENVYNAGVITVNGTGTSPYIGGIMGGREAENYKLKNAYNLGEIKNLGNISKAGALSGSKCLMSTDCYYLQGTYSVGIYNEDTPDNPDNSGEKTETDIKALMNTNLVTLEEWEAGPDGYPVLSCFKTAE